MFRVLVYKFIFQSLWVWIFNRLIYLSDGFVEVPEENDKANWISVTNMEFFSLWVSIELVKVIDIVEDFKSVMSFESFNEMFEIDNDEKLETNLTLSRIDIPI